MNYKTMTGAELIGQVEEALNEMKRRYTKSIAPKVEEVKTANEQRAELIWKAKIFTERNIYKVIFSKIEFVINHEKRTVVALLKGFFNRHVESKGIAKCHPDDVFNADIGKAIALARALEIEIPEEFLRAVQPTEFVLGQRVNFSDEYPNLVVSNTTNSYAGLIGIDSHSITLEDISIIDDTNAEYSL